MDGWIGAANHHGTLIPMKQPSMPCTRSPELKILKKQNNFFFFPQKSDIKVLAGLVPSGGWEGDLFYAVS